MVYNGNMSLSEFVKFCKLKILIFKYLYSFNIRPYFSEKINTNRLRNKRYYYLNRVNEINDMKFGETSLSQNHFYGGGTFKGNLKRKNNAEQYDQFFIDLIKTDKKVNDVIYFNDYTEKKNSYNGDGYLEPLEQIENTLNMLGADCLVYTHRSYFIDFKVLNYYEKYNKTNQVYNGNLCNTYGMDNLLIQYRNTMFDIHNPEGYGWGNKPSKVTDYILAYVPNTKFLYVLDYKKLIKFTNRTLKDKNIEYEKLRFEKRKGYSYYYELCLSVPISDLVENGVVKKFYNLNCDIIKKDKKNTSEFIRVSEAF